MSEEVVPGISVLVLAKNEQQDLPGCLESLRWSDDIHVYDSGSEDATVQIARSIGATVTIKSYPPGAKIFGGDEAAHKNWGLQNIPFKHPWVYCSDADERMTPELVQEIHDAIRHPNGCVAFLVRRRDFLFGRSLRFVTPSPFNIRLIRPEHIRYERLTNPVTRVEGPTGKINAHFNHYPFSKGMAHWLNKHNAYSTLEARQIFQNRQSGTASRLWKCFFASGSTERRFHQKELFYRLPMRPVLMFVLLYVVRLGFLDGRAGLVFAVLRSIYEYFIVLKVDELSREAEAPNEVAPDAQSHTER